MGTSCTFTAAFLQALSFNLSTWAIRRNGRLTAPGMMTNAALVMGALSLCALPFICGGFLNGFWERFPALAGIVISFVIAQTLVFIAQRNIDASRLVPLLGLKLPMLAALSFALGTEDFNRWKIMAVCLTVLSAFVLNNSGRKIPLPNLVYILLGCFFYCCSDMFIREEACQIQNQLHVSTAVASMQTTFLSYILMAIVCSIALPFMKSQVNTSTLAYALPYSIVWLAGIVFLTIGFSELGTVNGNIIQATRGIITVAMAPALIGMGMTWLENRVTPGILLRRFLAAAMMLASVILYNHH